MSNLATNAALNAKIYKVQNKIHNITNLATTAAVSHVENEVADGNKNSKIVKLELDKIVKLEHML